MVESGYNLIMESKLNPFDILHISEYSTNDEIRERYLLMSKTFHPDKQPLDNWDLTKQYFESIDRAYKLISTQMRKYIYFRFGVDGIDMLERFPDEFAVLEGKQCSEEGKQEIDEMMFHFYFSDKRDYLDDQGKVDGMTVIDISAFFEQQFDDPVRGGYAFPLITKIQSTYTLAGPTIFTFQNNIMFQFASKNYKKNVGTALLSTKRLTKNILLKNFAGYGTQGFSNSTSLEYIYSPTLVARCSLINYTSEGFDIPKFQIQKRFENGLVFTSETNIESTSLQIFAPGEKLNKSVSFSYGNDSVEANLSLDYAISESCKFQIQLNGAVRGDITAGGLSYGIVMDASENTKISVISRFSLQNFLDIRINYGKYNIRLPIVCSSLDDLNFQILKMAAMTTLYFVIRLHTSYTLNRSYRKHTFKVKSFVRLSDEQSKYRSDVNEIQGQEGQKVIFETITAGLIILASYVGSEKQIRNIAKKVKKIPIDPNIPIESTRQKLQFFSQQVANTTKKVQVLVKGGRIQHEQLKVYNPCYDQKQQPMLFIYYSLRGQVKSIIQSQYKQINIGLQKKKYNNPISIVLNWMRKIHLLQ